MADIDTIEVSGNLVDLRARRVVPATIRVRGGLIEKIRVDSGPRGKGFILPGFIDAHVHVESAMVVPSEFARAAVLHGTVAAVSDPHEIANVLGAPGVRYMALDGRRVNFRFFFGAPACVPATAFETSGGALGVGDVEELLDYDDIRYLSEVMNVPGVLNGDPDVMAKIAAAKRRGKPVDGHAPGLRGEALARYAAAGISTDHESLCLDEALEKIALGMKILVREGSAARILDELIPVIREHAAGCMFCTDDLHPDHLLRGHVNAMAARAVQAGADVFDVLRAACVNPARHYRLPVGLLREGDPADFIMVGDLRDFRVLETWIGGRKAAERGTCLIERAAPEAVNNFSARLKVVEDFAVPAGAGALNVIAATDGRVVTGRTGAAPRLENGRAIADPGRDLLKLAVVNRYQDARPATGFVQGFGLRSGALASSVAHDSHNIVAVGADDASLCAAVNSVIRARGGLALAAGRRELTLPLPVAGIMSADTAESVARACLELDCAARELGSGLRAPFMTLSFMALLVIPRLKLSDRGLFDGDRFGFIPLFAG